MVRFEPSSAIRETRNVNWSYLRLNEALDILNYVDYMDVSFLQADIDVTRFNILRLLFCFILKIMFSYTARRKNVMVTLSHLR